MIRIFFKAFVFFLGPEIQMIWSYGVNSESYCHILTYKNQHKL